MKDWKYQILRHLVFAFSQKKSLHLRSAHDKVRKNVGTPNCFTLAKTSDLNFFQYDGVPSIELINLKAWPFDTYCLTGPLKHELFNTPAFNETPGTFHMAYFCVTPKNQALHESASLFLK